MTLQFGARNAKFPNNDQLWTDDNFTLWYIRGGLAMLGWILDLKEGTERNYMLPLSEVQ